MHKTISAQYSKYTWPRAIVLTILILEYIHQYDILRAKNNILCAKVVYICLEKLCTHYFLILNICMFSLFIKAIV